VVDEEKRGIPIYLDPVSRSIVSSGDEEGIIEVWHPSNKPAKRLWACVEILRDVNDLLEEGARTGNKIKLRRKVKFIAGNIHSLAKAVNGLCKTMIGERDIRGELGEENVKLVQDLQKEFSEFVPFQWNEELTNYRNKLVAHFDDSFWPKDASKMLNSVPTNKIGVWLHSCLHVLLDLTNLNVYHWSCESGHKSYVKFMSNEPYIVTMKVDEDTNRLTQLAGLDIANESPRRTVQDVVLFSIDHSQWMFKKEQPRIGSLKDDGKESWVNFLQTKELYKTEI